MSVYLVSTKHNGVTKSIFNNHDYNSTQTTINSAKYVQITSSTMTGSLSAVGLTSTNGFTTIGTTKFNTNITLPTIYKLSPNTALPTTTQLGSIITVTASATADFSNSTASICNITLSVGVWAINYRELINYVSVCNGIKYNE